MYFLPEKPKYLYVLFEKGDFIEIDCLDGCLNSYFTQKIGKYSKFILNQEDLLVVTENLEMIIYKKSNINVENYQESKNQFNNIKKKIINIS